MQALKMTGNVIWNVVVPQAVCLTGIILNQTSKKITGNSFSEVMGQFPQHTLTTLEKLISVAGACFDSMKDINLLKGTILNNREIFQSVAVATITATCMYAIANRMTNKPLTVFNKITLTAIPIIAISATVGSLFLIENSKILQLLIGGPPTPGLNFVKQIKAYTFDISVVSLTANIASKIPFFTLKGASGITDAVGYLANKVSAFTNGATNYFPSFRWPRV